MFIEKKQKRNYHAKMETFELRYFFAVASHENLRRAATDLAVSPGSLSKAVSRLEDELGVPLFTRVSRNIRLTDSGRILQQRAAEILRLTEATKAEIKGQEARLRVRAVGPEVLLTKVGRDLAATVHKVHPLAVFEFVAASEPETIAKVRRGEAHIGLVTTSTPAALKAKTLFDTTFQTCVGRGHPLFRRAQAGSSVPIEELLKFPFVCPERSVLGEMGAAQAADGWRDDKFPRRIDFTTTSLQLLTDLVTNGGAVAYLPDYVVEQIPVAVLKMTGCPYTCKQTVRMIAFKPETAGWLARLF